MMPHSDSLFLWRQRKQPVRRLCLSAGTHYYLAERYGVNIDPCVRLYLSCRGSIWMTLIAILISGASVIRIRSVEVET